MKSPDLRPIDISGIKNQSFRFGCSILIIILWQCGCKVGPEYHQPAPVGTNTMPATFTGVADTSSSPTTWVPAEPSAHLPRGAWWEIFQDPELNRIERLAAGGNQEISAAVAHFQQARSLANIARGELFPNITAAPSWNRQRTSANSPNGRSSTYSLFNIPVDAGWELDLWGRVRHSTAAARNRLDAAADDLECVKLSIQAEVAINYLTLRALEAQKKLLQQTIANYQRSLQLTQNRRKGGIATDYDVSLSMTQLKTVEARLPAIELQGTSLRHSLATLCGVPINALNISAQPIDPNAVVVTVPVTVPSELLEHRPDIAAAQRRMSAANSEIGIAVSAFYPRLTLNGLASMQSVDGGSLFSWPSHVWSVGPSLQLPIFNGGQNRARHASAVASYEAAVANYRQIVLKAFQEVEDLLAAQHYLSIEFEAEYEALKAARRTLEISTNRYKGGVVTYLEVVIAQGSSLSHEQSVVQLSASRMIANVSLIKALGAGWSRQIEKLDKPKDGHVRNRNPVGKIPIKDATPPGI